MLPEFSDMYARAREEGGDFLAREILEIADAPVADAGAGTSETDARRGRRLMPAEDGGMLRQFIPVRLDDNPSMLEADPGYEAKLEGLGSRELVAALRWGDWDVVEGAFFDCWETKKHVIAPFVIPPDWPRIRSMDWGSGGAASPCSIGWWAVVQDDFASHPQHGLGLGWRSQPLLNRLVGSCARRLCLSWA
jgi:hypothetical protein